MATNVIMPKMGLTMVNGTVVRWLKKTGDRVEKGEPLVEIESDKSTFELEAPAGGLLQVLVSEGEVVPVAQVIGVIGEPGEEVAEAPVAVSAERPGEGAEESRPADKVEEHPPETPRQAKEAKIKISPRARRLARSKDLDFSLFSGTGPQGRITEKDVLCYLENRPKATPLAASIAKEKGLDLGAVKGTGIAGRVYSSDLGLPQPVPAAGSSPAEIMPAGNTGTDGGPGQEALEIRPYKGMRKVIGERLSQSKFTAPHIYFRVSVDMSRAVALRKVLQGKRGIAVSFNDIIVFAAARALTKHPELNASLLNEEIVLHSQVNIGIAVALDNGLIVPVVRGAHRKGLGEISRESRSLIEKAKNGTLGPDEYKGGTFTVSNLGMTGVDEFTAIINPPEAAILAVGRIARSVVVAEDEGEEVMVIKPMMNLILSVDHRIIDGFTAAQFLQTLKDYLEEPSLLL